MKPLPLFSPGLVFELVPARPGGPHLIPLNDQTTWTPGENILAPDRVLGAAAALQGAASIELTVAPETQPRNALTLSTWVRWGDPDSTVALTAGADPPCLTITLERSAPGPTTVSATLGDETFAQDLDLDALPPADGLDPVETAPGAWRHVAFVWDGVTRSIRFYQDGVEVASGDAQQSILPYCKEARIVIGRGATSDEVLWVGPARLYARMRTPAELLAERQADLAAHPTLDEWNPLDFRLTDDSDDPRLYITDDDAAGRRLHLVIENRSRFPVALPMESDRSKWLELRFRPGCLVGEAHYWVEPHAPGWRVESEKREDGISSLYLSRTQALLLAAGQSAAITLNHVRASGTFGAHGTFVELRYAHPHYDGIECSRGNPARVVGQRGRRRSPLRFGAAGDRTVRNDGLTPNRLSFYVANTSSTRHVPFSAPVNGVGTALVLSLEAGSAGDAWALATVDQLLAATVSVQDPPDWRVVVETQGESPEWILTPTRDQELAPGEQMSILVEDLITHLPAGQTAAYLHFENIEGYWDQDSGVELEKSAVRRDVATAALDVGGKLLVEGSLEDAFGELLPPGVIVMWHGSEKDIPAGWVLCDGQNGSPDLTNRFVLGGPGPAPAWPQTRTGGGHSFQLAEGQLPAHRHDFTVTTQHQHAVPMAKFPAIDKDKYNSAGQAMVLVWDQAEAFSRSFGAGGASGGPDDLVRSAVGSVMKMADQAATDAFGPGSGATPATDLATVKVSGSTSPVGNGAQIDNRPAFYTLCFIMKRFPGSI